MITQAQSPIQPLIYPESDGQPIPLLSDSGI